MFLIHYHQCVVPENIHTPMGGGGNGNSEGRGVQKGGNLLEWKFQGWGSEAKLLSVGGMDIFWNYTLFL